MRISIHHIFHEMKARFPKAYSLWRRIAIFRGGKNIVSNIYKWINEIRQKQILQKSLGEFSSVRLIDLRDVVLRYLENLRVKDEPTGRFFYSVHSKKPILYASIYGALLYDLLNMIGDLSLNERNEWLSYINSFQCDDGLFRDPQVNNANAELIDWWGWRHLSAHVVSAVTALGGKIRYPLHFLKFLYKPGLAYDWINKLPWRQNYVNVSNMVMNYGVLLQYERDFWNNDQAGLALTEIFEFLDRNINHDSGLWYRSYPANDVELLDAVQTSYHLWNLYFYDRRNIPYIEKSIDNCLKLQNRYGGFGFQINENACHDIDVIDPLCRFFFMTDYRQEEISKCLNRSLRWVMVNQMKDGGFVYSRFESFKYGHELMETGPEESNLFATWFRLLSIAYIDQVLDLSTAKLRFNLKLHCPGYQFWNDCTTSK